MSAEIPPRFRKTRSDKWAVMAPVETLEKALASGGSVQVLKKSGDWSEFRVVSLGKPFDVDGVQMCYGYDDEGDSGTGGATTSNSGAAGAARPASSRGRSPAYADTPSQSGTIEPPPPDPSEPLPEYTGESDADYQDW